MDHFKIEPTATSTRTKLMLASLFAPLHRWLSQQHVSSPHHWPLARSQNAQQSSPRRFSVQALAAHSRVVDVAFGAVVVSVRVRHDEQPDVWKMRQCISSARAPTDSLSTAAPTWQSSASVETAR